MDHLKHLQLMYQITISIYTRVLYSMIFDSLLDDFLVFTVATLLRLLPFNTHDVIYYGTSPKSNVKK